jgi:glycosyltransferase involved in cell wall biosynthesis
MRVVIVTRIFSPEASAASFVLEAVATGFRDAGHDVTVLTTKPPAHLKPSDPTGISVRRSPVIRDSSGYVRGYLPYLSFDIPVFFRLLFTPTADVYLVEPPPTTGAVTRVATWLLRRPYVYEVADIWADAAKMATSSKVVLALLRWVEKFAIGGADHAFAVSRGVADRLSELGISTPTTVTGFGVDAESFRFRPAEADQAPYFVYAGSFSEWHGAGIFVGAFAKFWRDHPQYRLLYVGQGSERTTLERMGEQHGLPIEFWDPIPGIELNSILAGATASLASLKPGQGYDYAFTTKVYSSFAAGCPVIFAGVGPTAEFVTRANQDFGAGEAVRYEVDEVAAAMERFARAPLPSSKRQSLSDWTRAEHSLTSTAKAIVETSVTLGSR